MRHLRNWRGEYVDVSKMKTGEYLEYWLENHAATVKLTSTQLYRSMIKVHCIPHLGHIPLQKLTTRMFSVCVLR